MESDDADGSNERQEYLQTRYVFLDTSAYVGAQLDWTGPRLSKLTELGRDGTVQLLITDVTCREIYRKIEERVDDALKHLTILGHAGLDIGPAQDRKRAIQTAQGAFENFLKAADVEIIPIKADLPELIDDYFEGRPPFSAKKRNEWRDAIVCKSLLAKAADLSVFELEPYKIYIVSSDPDFGAVCSSYSDFIKAESIADIISRGTVSIEVYERVRAAVLGNVELPQSIATRLAGRDAHIPPMGLSPKRNGKIRSARVEGIHQVFVIDHQGSLFDCEVSVDVSLDVTIENFDEADDPRAWYTVSQQVDGRVAVVVGVKYGDSQPTPTVTGIGIATLVHIQPRRPLARQPGEPS